MSVAPETGRNRIMGQNPTAPMWSSSKLPTVTRCDDIRHTVRSLLSRVATPDIAELCVGHVLRGMRKVYEGHGGTTCSSPSRCIDERHLGTGSRVHHGAGHRGAAIGIVAANCFQLGCVARECPSGGGPSWLRPGMKSEEFDIHP
jgi:hypothetical protein